MSKKIDYISDLHIEMWDQRYDIKYPCGETSDYPLDINIFKNSNSKILIASGDISDDLELSIKKLDEIGKYYDKVLFIDGNHEHINKIPTVYENYEINKLINKHNKSHNNKNNKLHFLSISPFQIGSTIIIGRNGWWDYNNWDNNIIKEETENYFKEWFELSEEKSRKFCYNCMIQAKKDFNDLKYLIEKYEKDNTIKEIIIVTHTVPLKIFATNFKTNTECNSEIEKLCHISSKISHWIFGHSHRDYNYKYNDIRFISNPRGRPNDENRENYSLKSIEI